MNARKRLVRRGLAGGGFVTLLLAAAFVALDPVTTPATIGVVAWLALVGAALLVAGRRERVDVGSRTVGWPRLAAVAIALLALGWGTISVVALLEGDGITGLGSLELVLTAGMVAYFAWFARECWLGGELIPEETFVLE